MFVSLSPKKFHCAYAAKAIAWLIDIGLVRELDVFGVVEKLERCMHSVYK